MRLLKDTFKRIILIIVLISIIITFLATPAAYAKLDLAEGDFYYSGTTKGTYVPTSNIFSWLINALGQIADFILGLLSLIIRMPFIGWTALLEKMLTWALESTMGVSADGSMIGTSVNDEGEIEINTGDLTGLTDSSNNVTVESIVYNRVAALDIDIFDLEFDRTLSATGQKLVCKKCEKKDSVSGSGNAEYTAKYVEDCLAGKLDQIKADAASNIEKRLAGEEVPPLDIKSYCECDCNGCDACQFYLAQMEQNEPLIFKLKQLVATWYKIIQYLAIAAMLLVLLGVGIKMALSTIASDKAVYKRMLVDWCIGMILIFGMHYFMIFVINLNEILVNTISDSAQSINKVQMAELGIEEAEYSDSELELKIYEEVRTRAYDAKVSNGMIGMIMYMTLVFFAFKYVIIYLKRFLTIIVLTLMAPAIGVAYALQKVLSGKSSALKTWMKEYIMNVIVQSVHALIYAIFISQALVMSLQNVAGMVMALILMNYTSKADQLFKKIFSFGGGDSLLGHTEGAADSLKQNMNAALGFAAGAKPMAKALTNTPYGKAVKGIGKAAVAAGVYGARKVSNGINRASEKRFDRMYENEIDKEMESMYGTSEAYKNSRGEFTETDSEYEARRAKAKAAVDAKLYPALKPGELSDEQLRELGGHELKYQMDESKNAMKTAKDDAEKEDKKEDYEVKRRNYNKFREVMTPTNKQIADGHFEKLISMENVFTTGKPTGEFAGLKTAWIAAMGSSHYEKKGGNWKNPVRNAFNPLEPIGKWVNDKNSVFDQLRASELLGLTDKDKKLLKEFGGDMIKGFVGMGSLFVGMGTIVANPKIGMGLLANGIASTNKVFGRDTNLARTPAKYKFGRFSPQSIDSIRNSAIAQAQYEHDTLLAEDLKRRHPDLVKKIKDGVISGATIAGIEAGSIVLSGSAGLGFAAAAFLPTAAAVGGASMIGTRLMRNTRIAGKLAEIDKHHTKQQKELIDKFNNEADKEMLNSSKASAEDSSERFMGYFEDAYEKGEVGDKEKDLEAKLKEMGYSKKETEQELKEKQEIKVETVEIEKDEVKLSNRDKMIGLDSSLVAKTIDIELDRIIAEKAAGGIIEFSSKATQNEIMTRLGLVLEKEEILEKGGKASRLLSGGEAALIRKLKIKAAVKNKAIEDAQEKLKEALKPEDVSEVTNIFNTILQENINAAEGENSEKKRIQPLEQITVEDILERMQPSTQDGSNPVNQKDGSRSVNNPDEPKQTSKEDEAKKKAVEAFLDAMKQTKVKNKVTISGEVAEEAFMDITERAKKEAKKNAIKTTQDKLQQVLSLAIENESLLENGKFGGTVLNDDGTVKLGFEVDKENPEMSTLTAREYTFVNDTVKSLLEMKRLNEKVLKREPDIKKDGTKAYLKKMKENSVSMIGIAENKKEILSLELERTSGARGERITEIDETIKKLTADNNERRQKIDANRDALSRVGPVQDVDLYIKNTLFKNKGRK